MSYRATNKTITDVMGSVTEGTINMIQSSNESVKKQLIARYCGRLSTWEPSWYSVLKDGQVILEAHDAYPGHWHSHAPVLPALACASGRTFDKHSDSASDKNCKSVSAINKVLERYNLVRKRRLQ